MVADAGAVGSGVVAFALGGFQVVPGLPDGFAGYLVAAFGYRLGGVQVGQFGFRGFQARLDVVDAAQLPPWHCITPIDQAISRTRGNVCQDLRA